MPTIQSLRRSRGMTLVELALATGVPARRLGEIELGLAPLDANSAIRLSLCFDMAPAQLGVAQAARSSRSPRCAAPS